jgi:hypothetical protein
LGCLRLREYSDLGDRKRPVMLPAGKKMANQPHLESF